jgi:hypothetical protein
MRLRFSPIAYFIAFRLSYWLADWPSLSRALKRLQSVTLSGPSVGEGEMGISVQAILTNR